MEPTHVRGYVGQSTLQIPHSENDLKHGFITRGSQTNTTICVIQKGKILSSKIEKMPYATWKPDDSESREKSFTTIGNQYQDL